MGSSSSKKPDPPAPTPIVKTSDAAEGASVTTSDIRRRRGAFLKTIIAGESGTGNNGSGGFMRLGGDG